MRRLVWSLLPAMVLVFAPPAHATDPLADEIVKALTGGNKLEERSGTRSLGGAVANGGANYQERSFLGKDSLRAPATRSVEIVKGTLLIQPGEAPGPVIQGGVDVAAAPVDPPKLSFDLYVTFPFGSHELTETAKKQLASVALALKHPELAGKTIQIAGHTDAVGTAEDNMRLSISRAAEVQNFLTETYGIERSRIRTVGYGESRLKDATQPTAGINRRVELVNLGNETARAD